MKVYLLRHGETDYNAERRYQGSLDIPLSEQGMAALCPAGFRPEKVYVSPMLRARQTADRVFPGVEQVVVYDLKEMHFGVFEGRTPREMAHDAEYRAWIDSGCEDRCPEGERRVEFSGRTCAVFESLVNAGLKQGDERLVILAHGGTQMALMAEYVKPRRDYYDWCGPNAGGYVLEIERESWEREKRVTLLETVQYIKPAADS